MGLLKKELQSSVDDCNIQEKDTSQCYEVKERVRRISSPHIHEKMTFIFIACKN